MIFKIIFIFFLFLSIVYANNCFFDYDHINERGQFLDLINKYNLYIGAEIGVQKGIFASHILKSNLKKYYLIDPWTQLDNYLDSANVNNYEQLRRLSLTISNTKKFSQKTVFLIGKSVDKYNLINDKLDFLYIDARHDYCGVIEDLTYYFPLMNNCSIIAGHDYLTALEQKQLNNNDDFSVCEDGSVYLGAVKGAIQDFFSNTNYNIMTTKETWPSWYVFLD